MEIDLKVSQAEYARIRGLSRQRINILVKDGRVPLDADGMVDVEAADLNMATLLDRSKANRDRQVAQGEELPLAPAAPVPPPATPERDNSAADYWNHKARREETEADLAELRLQEKLGMLISADEVRRSRRETAYQIANALLQIPARVAPVIAPQDPQRAEKLLAEEITRVLNGLAGDLEGDADDDPKGSPPRAA